MRKHVNRDVFISMFGEKTEGKHEAHHMTIRNDVLYLSGQALAVRWPYEKGSFGKGIKFIINADVIRTPGWGHSNPQNMCIQRLKPNVQIPFSALSSAGLGSLVKNWSDYPNFHLRILDKREDTWEHRCTKCGREIEDIYIEEKEYSWNKKTLLVVHKDDGSALCGYEDPKIREAIKTLYEDSDSGFLVKRIHKMGGVLLKFGREVFLSSRDEQELKHWQQSYFLCQIPDAADWSEWYSIDDALEALKPKEVKKAEKESIPIERQGDIFFIRTNHKTYGSLLRHVENEFDSNLAEVNGSKNYVDILNSRHRVTWKNARIYKNELYVTGRVTHSGKQHSPLDLNKDYWWKCVKNTALGSWDSIGYVD